MGVRLEVISTTVSELVAQAEGALSEGTLPDKPDKVTQITNWLDQVPRLGWGLVIFVIFAIAVAAVAKLTGNLDNIVSFFSESTLARLRPNCLRKNLSFYANSC